MRLGGPVYGEWNTAEEWAQLVTSHGYRAAYCPIDAGSDDERVQSFIDAAATADIVIAEVGAWSNPISRDEAEREKNINKNITQLGLADRIGARCCVNVSGSRNPEKWCGPSMEDLTQETFDCIVETAQTIIDAVNPTRTHYCLETMPWSYPDSADSYLQLIECIDRPGFAVHLDPTNLICSPQRWAHNGDLIRDSIEKLGPQIKSVHAKDINLSTDLMVHLDEVRPGLGQQDYRTMLTELDLIDPDTPLMMEHLPNADEYKLAGEYIRSVAEEVGVSL
jgi:sugar phosphate isomerase/epimerase